MQVGDLVKFLDSEQPESNDLGIVISVKGRMALVGWAKTGIAGMPIDRLLCEKEYFEIITSNST